MAAKNNNKLKGFLNDSYTAFKNKIGLAGNNHFITEGKDVVIAWPYKDCILEAGQTKEDQHKDEILWNETIHAKEIDLLLAPKALANFKSFDKDGGQKIAGFSAHDNLVIKGNNLMALHSLAKRYAAKVKLIYIDPPYNTGSDGFNYNDSFTHSTWLTFMKNRLEAAYKLLSDDGSIWINIDDKECHYLKVLCDEIFGRDNFIINFIWQKKYAPANDAKWFSDTHDHILVFAKNKTAFKPNLLPRTVEMNKRYANPDKDPRGDWKPGGFSVKTYSKDYDYPITTPSGKIVYPPKGSCWQTSKENYKKKLADGRIWFGANGDSKPQLKQFLSEVQQGTVAKSIWAYDEVGHNQVSRAEIIKLFGDFSFATPKPEKLLKRIISLGSNEGDYVLDFFLGSGTTAAVAHKMRRHYIGIDQMSYIETVAVERLKKVIAGEQGGISEEVGWQGGGSFKYFELMPLNMVYIQQLDKIKTTKELDKLIKNIAASPFANYAFAKLKEADWIGLSDNDKRKLATELLDKNQLYLPYSDVEDADYKIPPDEIKLNHAFYNYKG